MFNIKNSLIEFSISLIFSLLVCAAAIGIYIFLNMLGLEINFGGDKSVIFFGIFLGLPIGSVLGIVLVNKFLFHRNLFKFLKVIVGLAFGVGGGVLGILLMDKLGARYGIFLIPFIVNVFCLVGFKIVRSDK